MSEHQQRPHKAPTKKRELAPTSVYPILTRSKRAKLFPIVYIDEQSRRYRRAQNDDENNINYNMFYIELQRGQKSVPEPKWPEVGTVISLQSTTTTNKDIELAYVGHVGYDNTTKSTYILLHLMQ